MKTLFVLSIFLWLVLACKATKNMQVPENVQQSLKALYPKAENVKWDKEGTNFEANFEVNDVELSILLDAKGNLLETEKGLEVKNLPAPVKTNLSKDFFSYEIKEAAKIVRNGKTTYEAELKKGETKLDAIYSPDGKLIKKIEKQEKGEESEKAEQDEKEENEENEHEQIATEAGWQQSFNVNKSSLENIGENPYFILKPGYRLTLSGKEDGKKVDLVITVLNETKLVDGVETRVVEERESHDGALVEVSRNYYDIDPATKDVYYFGEAVDIYKNGQIVGHEGAWQSGQNGAHFGLMMPGKPRVEQKYYQEVAPGVAMDRAEIESVTEHLDVPAGLFKNCLKTEETTPLEHGVKEYKIYAPGIGLILDGSLKLAKYGK